MKNNQLLQPHASTHALTHAQQERHSTEHQLCRCLIISAGVSQDLCNCTADRCCYSLVRVVITFPIIRRSLRSKTNALHGTHIDLSAVNHQRLNASRIFILYTPIFHNSWETTQPAIQGVPIPHRGLACRCVQLPT
jgi:hypothetical protein